MIESGFVVRCPVRLQEKIFLQVHDWLVDHPDPRIQRLFYENSENVCFLLEIVRQSARLPFSTYSTYVVYAIQLYRRWLENTLPPFLADEQLDSYVNLNIYLRIIIRDASAVFVPQPPESAAHVETHIRIYRHALKLMRHIALQDSLVVEPETWNVLHGVMADLAEALLNTGSTTVGGACSSTLISDQKTAGEMANIVLHALFLILVMSMSTNEAVWTRFRAVLSQATRWPQTIEHWSGAVLALTKLMSRNVYGVEVIARPNGMLDVQQPWLQTATAGSKFAAAAAAAAAASSSANVPGTRTTQLTRNNSSATDRSRTTTAAIHRQSTSGDLEIALAIRIDTIDIALEARMQQRIPIAHQRHAMVLFLFQNVVSILGNINDIADVGLHRAAVKCVVRLIDNLAAVRDRGMRVPLGDKPVPPLFQFSPWILQAAAASTDDVTVGSGTAYGAVCRLMNRWSDRADADAVAWWSMPAPVPMSASTPTFPSSPNATATSPEQGLSRQHSQSFLSLSASALPSSPHISAHALAVLPLFYELIRRSMHANNPDVFSHVIRNSTRVFATCLPGAEGLAPSFLRGIRHWLVSPAGLGIEEIQDDELRSSAIQILASLSGVCTLLGDAPLVDFRKVASVGTSAAEDFRSENGSGLRAVHRQTIQQLVQLPAARQTFTTDQRAALLCCLTTAASDEMYAVSDVALSTSSSSSMAAAASSHLSLNDTITTLLDHIRMTSVPIVTAAVDCLTFLANACHSINASSSRGGSLSRLKIIEAFERIVAGLRAHLSNERSRPEIIALLLNCLLEWVTAFPAVAFVPSPDKDNAHLAEIIFGALDVALMQSRSFASTPTSMSASSHGAGADSVPVNAYATTPTTGGAPTPMPTMTPTSAVGEEIIATLQLPMVAGILPALLEIPRVRVGGGGPLTSNTSRSSEDDGADAVGTQGTDEATRTIALQTLVHMLHYLQFFPTPVVGAAQLTSDVVETDDAGNLDTLGVALSHDSTALSVLDLGGKYARIIARNMSGKYAWDFKPFYGEPPVRVKKDAPELAIASPRIALLTEADEATPSGDIVAPSPLRVATVLAAPEPASDAAAASVSESLRSSPSTPMTPTPSAGGSATAPPSAATSSPADNVEAMLAALSVDHPECLLFSSQPLNAPPPVLDSTASVVSAAATRLHSQVHDERTNAQTGRTAPRHANPEAPKALPSTPTLFERGRLLLHDFGILPLERQGENNSIQVLNKSSKKFSRDIPLVDKVSGRATLKIGVLYVAEGQETEAEMFANSEGSADYTDFVDGLGWQVDVATHPGFLGGLEPNKKSGATAPYFATAINEVIFHVSTQIPMGGGEKGHDNKKRHVGNDDVLIVWNDHYRRFDPLVFKSRFASVKIIVTPLPSGLFHVEILNEKGYCFGPLTNGAIVSKRALAPLVRTTAINASWKSIEALKSPPPFSNRLTYLSDLMNRTAMPSISPQQYLMALTEPTCGVGTGAA